jgi:hypothetical protein
MPIETPVLRPSRRSIALVVLTLVGLLLGSSQAFAAQITGISDENVTRWDAAANTVFSKINVPQVRYITAWGVATHASDSPCETACQRFNDLKAWITKAESQGNSRRRSGLR